MPGQLTMNFLLAGQAHRQIMSTQDGPASGRTNASAGNAPHGAPSKLAAVDTLGQSPCPAAVVLPQAGLVAAFAGETRWPVPSPMQNAYGGDTDQQQIAEATAVQLWASPVKQAGHSFDTANQPANQPYSQLYNQPYSHD